MFDYRAVIAGAVVAFISTQVSAQDAAAPAPAPWGTICTSESRTSDLQCLLEQRVVASDSGALLAAVSVRPTPGQADPVLVVQLPVGLYLPAGLIVAVDGTSIESLPFQTCDAQGCYVGAPAKPELINAMKAGQTLELVIQDQSQREIKIPVALAGFTGALEKAL